MGGDVGQEEVREREAVQMALAGKEGRWVGMRWDGGMGTPEGFSSSSRPG